MNKKIILLAVIIVLILVIVLALIFGRKKTSSENNTNGIASIGSVKTQKVLNEKVFFPKIISNNEIKYYSSTEENVGFYSYNFETNQKKQISIDLDAPEHAIWNEKGDKIILKIIYKKYAFEKRESLYQYEGAEDNDVVFFVYDFNLKKLYPLSRNIDSIVWLNNNELIYNYLGTSGKNRITKSNFDGSNFQVILENVWYVPLLHTYTKDKILILADKEADQDTYIAIFELNIITKKLRTLAENTFDLEISKKGKNIAYLSEKGQDFLIKIVDKEDISLDTNTLSYNWLDDENIIFFYRDDKKFIINKFNINNKEQEALTSFSIQDTNNEPDNILALDNTVFFTYNDYLYKMDLKN